MEDILSDFSDKPQAPFLDWISIIVSILICVVGIFFNIISLFMMLILQEYKKASLNRYLIHLSIADICFLLTVPLAINESIKDSWNFPNALCQISEAMLFINYYASISFLVIISIDRYIAVCKPFSKTLMKVRKPAASHTISLLIWIFSVLGSIPIIMHSHVYGVKPHCRCQLLFPKTINATERCLYYYESINATNLLFPKKDFFILCEENVNENEKHKCRDYEETNFLSFYTGEVEDYSGADVEYGETDYDDPANFTYLNEDVLETESSPDACNYNHAPYSWHLLIYVNFIVMFLLPVSIMSVAYGLIIFRLNRTRRRHGDHGRKMSGKALVKKSKMKNAKIKKEKHVTILCLVLLITFIVCWLPFFVVHLAKLIGIRNANGAACVKYALVGGTFARLNSALNPILYNFIGVGFCARFKKFRSVIYTSNVIRSKRSKASSHSNKVTENGKSEKK